jgi:hypothetical protein
VREKGGNEENLINHTNTRKCVGERNDLKIKKYEK